MPRAWFIDAAACTIEAVEIAHGTPGLADMHKLVEGYIEIAHHWPNGDVLYVDEEGRLKGPKVGFRLALQADDQALAGNGLVVGREVETELRPGGYTTGDPGISIEELARLVLFVRFVPGRFECPRCGAVSFHPRDIAERYCGRCHVFVDDP
jgi:Domain of unknown function (DUF3846)